MKPISTLARWRPALIILGLVVIAAVVFHLATRPKPISVVVKTVDHGPVDSTVVNTRAGTVEACQRTKLSTILGGRIEFLGVKEGDKVRKGQLLLKLWNEDQQAQQGLAEAQRDSARKRQNEVCTAAESAAREAQRQKALWAKGFISEGREDAARTEAAMRAAACETARADVVQAEARIRVTRAEQGRTHLYAPFDGTVAKIVGELGEYSTPSPPGVPTPPAIDLIDDTCLYVKAPMDEVDGPRIRAGQQARITLDALPGKPLQGKVKRVAPYVSALEKQSRTVDIEVDFTTRPESGALLVGYSADVEVVLDSRPSTLRIPTAALIEGRKVLLLDISAGHLVEREVKTGLSNWEYTEVLNGLVAGDQLVVSLERPGVKAGVAAVADAAPAAR